MSTPRHIFALAAVAATGILATSAWTASPFMPTGGAILHAAATQGRGQGRGQGALTRRLVGTYQLQSGQSDDPRRAADQATRSMPAAQHDRAYQSLLNRLTAPDALAIDREDGQVTIASSNGPQTTFEANGVAQSEPGPNGRTITTRAEARGDQLIVTTTGNRGSDFTVTFQPVNNGEGLRVTRTLYTDTSTRGVTAQAYYTRTSDQADWNLYRPQPGPGGPAGGSLYVPDGTAIIATLDRGISTRDAREGDGFTMTVQLPSQFAGAQLDGAITRVNDLRRTGRQADLVLAFRDIRPRGGQQADFYGVLQSARLPDGTVVRIDAENYANDGPQGNAVQRGAVGATIGALLGAIAGGGKGAAIGAAVGGGLGAGTVLIDGRDQLDLPPGTELTIIAHTRR